MCNFRDALTEILPFFCLCRMESEYTEWAEIKEKQVTR